MTAAIEPRAIELRAIEKRYGAVVAVAALDLGIEEGQFVGLLGPSGCGKTTTLRMIAGLETPSSGDIFIKGGRVNDVPVHRRNIGVVFQNFALFPHKTAFENVAFGLRYRNVPRAEIAPRVRRALEIVRLPDIGERMPGQLSGGQQQRIAVARAIVIEPNLLLFDEPLSSLDAALREEMRIELKTIQRTLGITTVFVTHDQGEALAMSDKVVVMRDGRKVQEGAPEEVYNEPRSRFVAEFLGFANCLDGIVTAREGPLAIVRLNETVSVPVRHEAPVGARLPLVIRAERIAIGATLGTEAEATLLGGTVSTVDYLGLLARYFIDASGLRLQVVASMNGPLFRRGERVALQVRSRDWVVCAEDAAG